MEFRRIR